MRKNIISSILKIKPVIMAGGMGSRLWPLSRSKYPKQFMKLSSDLSLLQQTSIRNRSFGKPAIIINEEHRFIVAEQIKEVGVEADLIIEPESKNTAPCAIIAALFAEQCNIFKVLLLPADHYVENTDKYLSEINTSFSCGDTIVTIGIKPTFAHTGYGYIKVKKQLAKGHFQVEKFVEKPSGKLAQKYVNDGDYFWNSGIYVFDTNFMIKQFKHLHNELFNQVHHSFANAKVDVDFIRLEQLNYSQIKAISLDYAIIEHVKNMKMIKCNFSWNDLGSCNSFWDISIKDKLNNYFEGDVVASEVSNSYIRSKGVLTAVIGLDNVVVINTGDTVLVACKSKTEDVKLIVAKLEKRFKDKIK
jgi:mannose-1-phosphate guanylyltransferase/mannose-6-phosphate isomerase